MARILDGPPDGITRRSLLKAGALTAAAVATGCAEPDPPRVVSGAGGVCTVTPDFEDGPFYVNTGLVRQDVTEGHNGVPLAIRLVLRDAATCEPIAGLPVEIWSADARGIYSGVDNGRIVRDMPDTRGTTYLRGRQISAPDGEVRFDTIFPGWYRPRPPHLHFTAPFGNQAFTWQFFVEDAFCDDLYTTIAPYDTRGVHPRRTGDFAPEGLTIVPVGTPRQLTLDMEVTIDKSNLSRLARESA